MNKKDKEIITAENESSEEITFVKWITRNGKRVYPPNGKKAWALRNYKKKAS